MKSDALPDNLLYPLFPLGQILATPGAVELADRTNTNLLTLLLRHQRGDFGCICATDVELNRKSIVDGSRILSCYEVGTERERLWIISDAGRHATTVLKPSEY